VNTKIFFEKNVGVTGKLLDTSFFTESQCGGPTTSCAVFTHAEAGSPGESQASATFTTLASISAPKGQKIFDERNNK
jgi:hypothetical protein